MRIYVGDIVGYRKDIDPAGWRDKDWRALVVGFENPPWGGVTQPVEDMLVLCQVLPPAVTHYDSDHEYAQPRFLRIYARGNVENVAFLIYNDDRSGVCDLPK